MPSGLYDTEKSTRILERMNELNAKLTRERDELLVAKEQAETRAREALEELDRVRMVADDCLRNGSADRKRYADQYAKAVDERNAALTRAEKAERELSAHVNGAVCQSAAELSVVRERLREVERELSEARDAGQKLGEEMILAQNEAGDLRRELAAVAAALEPMRGEATCDLPALAKHVVASGARSELARRAAEARVAELTKALTKYGWHTDECQSLVSRHGCDCGFIETEALSARKEAGDGESAPPCPNCGDPMRFPLEHWCCGAVTCDRFRCTPKTKDTPNAD